MRLVILQTTRNRRTNWSTVTSKKIRARAMIVTTTSSASFPRTARRIRPVRVTVVARWVLRQTVTVKCKWSVSIGFFWFLHFEPFGTYEKQNKLNSVSFFQRRHIERIVKAYRRWPVWNVSGRFKIHQTVDVLRLYRRHCRCRKLLCKQRLNCSHTKNDKNCLPTLSWWWTSS